MRTRNNFSMKAFTKFISIILSLMLLCCLASCTDGGNDGEETKAPQSSSDETQDWGLGIVMPEK